ncbi:FecR family protein [Proteiniphilum sp. UBA5384]|jgi:ferric-dicitrate binding protein FerR (iron transport regulator)|uniref:FecR family protein n=1 Tax=Proteiniphilum sp. UBA5384 TaxID=1947279 RepID=UPI0025DAE581|nr:FecR family protein [Proteiniphilum sp. UBA5384]
MDKNFIRILIFRFFENDFPQKTFLKFQQWLTREEDSELKDDVLQELWERETTEANARTLLALKEMNKRIRKEKKSSHLSLSRRLLRIASILILPVIGGLTTYWIVRDNFESTIPKTEIVEHIVPDGEMKQILLPDGSEVWLNAGSMLLYADNLPGKNRHLFLNGEATFQVKKDPERPFIVKTQHMQIEALGTTFNVRSYIDMGSTAVTLEEGLVRVGVTGKVNLSEVIHPNEQFVYDHRLGITSLLQVDAELISRWREGYLVFEDASFEEIIHTVERRFNVIIQYDVRKYGGGRFSVKYTPYENVEQVLNILETLNPGLKWHREENAIYIE